MVVDWWRAEKFYSLKIPEPDSGLAALCGGCSGAGRRLSNTKISKFLGLNLTKCNSASVKVIFCQESKSKRSTFQSLDERIRTLCGPLLAVQQLQLHTACACVVFMQVLRVEIVVGANLATVLRKNRSANQLK